jgi:heat-inducible transcriptional repressor
MSCCDDDRLMGILEAVVASYIRLGRPVGSRYISNNFDVGLRPASIRNILAELETRGLLAKPHVSAGRIPTEKAYRLYLDRLEGRSRLKKGESRAIIEALDPGLPVDELLERTSKLLGTLSGQIGVAVDPGPAGGRITRLETVVSGSKRLMLSVTVEPGVRRTVVLDVEPGRSVVDARAVVIRMAGIIMGRSPAEARRRIAAVRRRSRTGDLKFAGLWSALDRLLRDGSSCVYLSGAGNLVRELSGSGELKDLLEVLESRQTLADMLLSGPAGEGSTVRLGGESLLPPLRGCGIVSSRYMFGTARGAVGIIGPVRMDYARLMAVLEFTSNQLTRLFAGREGEEGRAAER